MILKSKFRISYFFAFIMLGLMFSCQDNQMLDDNLSEELVVTTELTKLRAQVQNHNSYLELEKSNNTFYGQLAELEIEIFAIHDFITENNIAIDCKQTDEYAERFVGYEKYATAFCTKAEKISELRTEFKALNVLNILESKYVLSPINSENVVTRGYDCLDHFQAMFSAAESEADQDAAINFYDLCCKDEDGTYGCP